MRKKLLVRADDLGYCEAVNYGIERTVKQGIVKTVGLMPNMDAAEHGVRLLEGTGVCYGMHTNICNGHPLTDPGLVPSLVQPDGEFKEASVYRKAKEDFIVVDEAVLEIEAQLERFVELTGEEPHYFEVHSVFNSNFMEAMKIVAKRHQLPFFDINKSFYGFAPFGSAELHTYMEMDSMDPRYDPFENLRKAALQPVGEHQYCMLVCHPGYIDQYVLNTTYITTARPREAGMLYDPATRKWLEENEVDVITYDDLLS